MGLRRSKNETSTTSSTTAASGFTDQQKADQAALSTRIFSRARGGYSSPDKSTEDYKRKTR
ncbi:hypothetical protein ACFWB2_32055 [Streptomyces virginiae]|uniref:hypothetical protein n=1 Tax=Streptomyces virginiae TaxID=1961 RepID=UPI0036847365